MSNSLPDFLFESLDPIISFFIQLSLDIDPRYLDMIYIIRRICTQP